MNEGSEATKPTTAYLLLGSNLNDREALLCAALGRFEAARIQLIRHSSVYETAPQDVLDQPSFLNIAAEVQTVLGPAALLRATQRIEKELGRRRDEERPKGPRTMDIDILLYEDLVQEETELTIPHPRMLQRRFVLEPLCEIAPDLRHPGTGELLAGKLRELSGQMVERIRVRSA